MIFGRGLSSLALLSFVVAEPAALAASTQGTDIVAIPTLFSPVARSMQQLIGDGYQVINIAVGLANFGYLLKRDDKYVTCAVQPDQTHAELFRSECRKMN